MRVFALVLAALVSLTSPAWTQTTPVKYASAASNNSTLVKAGRVTLGMVSLVNSTGTVYYLKLFDKVTAPVCGTDTPKLVLAAPANGQFSPVVNQNFSAGLGLCLVAGIADSDNASAATGVVINLGVTGR